jgi:hypothetical protein
MDTNDATRTDDIDEPPHDVGDTVDELGYERESGTARADRVDEINAKAGAHGQGAAGNISGDDA